METSTTHMSTGRRKHATRLQLIATQYYFLSQIQLQPTRVRDGQASNCLDLVLTSTEELVTEIDILPGIGKSDHLTLRLDLRHTNASKQAPKPRFRYRKGNYEAMRRQLGSTEWETELEGKTTRRSGSN